eukprot:TRINITY_DN9386_c1_g5_i1.p1 TRINITY_DN9386_c1_g5~~TRINITY_DN9386_c1_g5_i1.p1  ORF type:complete len:188 (-),score=22.14 TRINITY_DN9386_c1_g5_i1:161-724(-)
MFTPNVALMLLVVFVLLSSPILATVDDASNAGKGLRGIASDKQNTAGAAESASLYAEAETLPALPSMKLTQTVANCSNEDMALINAKGGGHSHGSFPDIVAMCGKQGFSLWSGFHRSWMMSCIRKEVPISGSCASCYALVGTYAAANCKWACLWGSWCRTSCFECSEKARGSLNSCVGHKGPEPDHC